MIGLHTLETNGKPWNQLGFTEGPVVPQLTISLGEKELAELERMKEETGLPLSKLIQLRIRGFRIVRASHKNG